MGKQQCQVPTQRNVSRDRRYVVAEWMYQIAERLYPTRQFSRRLYHYSVLCLDRILLTPYELHGLLIDETRIQLLGLTCVELAIQKLLQKGLLSKRPRATNLLAFTGDKFSERDFWFFLSRIETLKPFEGVETALDSFTKYIDEGLLLDPQIESLALVLLDTFILEHSTTKHPPRFVACSAIAVARRLITKQATQQWTTQLVLATGCHFTDFQSCFEAMFIVAYLLFKEDNSTKTSSGTADRREVASFPKTQPLSVQQS